MDEVAGLKEANDQRSHRQGTFRGYINKLNTLVQENDFPNYQNVEGMLEKMVNARKAFVVSHDEVVGILHDNDLDVTTVIEKATELNKDAQAVYTRATAWLKTARHTMTGGDDNEENTPEESEETTGGSLDTTVLSLKSQEPQGRGVKFSDDLEAQLAEKEEENDACRRQIDRLAYETSKSEYRAAQISELERRLKSMEIDRVDRSRDYDRHVADLEREVKDRERELADARRSSFNGGLTTSTPMDTSKQSKSMLSTDEIGMISRIVSESNAEVFKDILNQSQQQHKALYTSFNIPKVELKKFTGDLTTYYAFTNRYDEMIGKTAATYAVKLSTLMQFCSDDIAEELDCCNHMLAPAGYALARKMLKSTYGDPFLVSEAWVDKLMKFGKLQSGADILRFNSILKSASETLTSLGYISELECTKSMKAIIKKTPVHVQNKWRAKHREAREKGQKATLAVMIKLIGDAASEMNDPVYGNDSLSKDDKEADVRPKKTYYGAKKKIPVVSANVLDEEMEAEEFGEVYVGDEGAPRESLPPKEACLICGPGVKTPHLTSRCFIYRDYGGAERLEFAKKKKLCFLCLASGHDVRACPSPPHWRCRMPGCTQRHHFTLHRGLAANNRYRMEVTALTVEGEGEKGDIEEYVEEECNSTRYTYHVSDRLRCSYVMPLVPVMLEGPGGYILTHVLLDTGSCVSLITVSAAARVGAKPIGMSNFNLKGLTGEQRLKAAVIDVKIQGRSEVAMDEAFNVVVMKDLKLNGSHVNELRKLTAMEHMKQLEIKPFSHNRIDALIGQDNAHLLEPLVKVSGRHKYSPFALRTRIGWVIHGHMADQFEYWHGWEEVNIADAIPRPRLEDTMMRMWELDRVPEAAPHSPDDRKIIRMWEKEIKLVEGHWVLPIPFKKEPPEFPDNYTQAKKSLERIGNRLEKNPGLKEQYVASMVKNFASGYAEIAPAVATPGYEWYNTHFAVITEKRPGKCRIVKNSSLKFRKTSLNDSVEQGPNLTNNITGVNIRFRTYEVAITADIKEMYNQVRVPEHQRDSLRFLWWEKNEPGGKIVKCRIKTHMFGGRWSGAASIKALNHTAVQFGDEYDVEVSETVHKDFYVDDWLKSIMSVERGIKLLMGLRAMLKRGGFELLKFGSNRAEILQALPSSDVAKIYDGVSLDIDEGLVDSTLGTLWRPKEDVFGFKIHLQDKPITRRGILSVYSTVYDPMGFVGPVILRAKLIVQSICQDGLSWDEGVPADLADVWRKWMEELPAIEELEIPRWLGASGDDENLYQLHVFSDASEVGYGANVYFCVIGKGGEIERSTLLISKAKVNPMKQVTIPRLELCAAVMGVRLEQTARKYIEVNLMESVFWCDSQIVLFYVKQQSRIFKTFVANRVAVIQEETEGRQWMFLPGEKNIADVTSRGATAEELVRSSTWMTGPEFLRLREDWPVQPERLEMGSKPERKREYEAISCLKIDVVSEDESSLMKPLLERFSEWPKLVKGVCYLRRFQDRLLGRWFSKDVVSAVEFAEAVLIVVGWLQAIYITHEQRCSPIFKKLFAHRVGDLWRVGGRLELTSLNFTERHPLILPRCAVTEMYIRQVHLRLNHPGVDRTYYEVRKEYWLLGGRLMVKKVVNACVDCRKFRGKPCEQIMAPLPGFKVPEGSLPFETVGLDYFGPVMVRVGRSDCKRWCCLISCAASRATHIEVVPDLTTAAFIDALNRFIARRGRPRRIVSDNGTNFVGAVRELGEMVKRWNRAQIKEHLREEMIEWQFNTPAASHHGGFWDRQNRTAREDMMKIVKNQPLSEYGLQTVMCRVEGIMNSRPLTRITDNPGEDLPITPNHLLLAGKRQGLAGAHSKSDGLRSKWKQIDLLTDEFWKTWTGSYLKNLQMRQKWGEEKQDIKVGELVMEVKANLYRMRWPLARVVEVYPGSDGHVRSVKIKTSEGEYERPISKIVRLELDL